LRRLVWRPPGLRAGAPRAGRGHRASSPRAERRNAMRSIAFTATFLVATSLARAQVVEKKSLSLDGARRAVAAVVGEAKAKGVGAVVAVVDGGGNLMAL